MTGGTTSCDGCLGARRCWVCLGSGKRHRGADVQACPKCDGTGRCPLCADHMVVVVLPEQNPVKTPAPNRS